MSHPLKNEVPLIEMQDNNGLIDGDSPYIETIFNTYFKYFWE